MERESARREDRDLSTAVNCCGFIRYCALGINLIPSTSVKEKSTRVGMELRAVHVSHHAQVITLLPGTTRPGLGMSQSATSGMETSYFILTPASRGPFGGACSRRQSELASFKSVLRAGERLATLRRTEFYISYHLLEDTRDRWSGCKMMTTWAAVGSSQTWRHSGKRSQDVLSLCLQTWARRTSSGRGVVGVGNVQRKVSLNGRNTPVLSNS